MAKFLVFRRFWGEFRATYYLFTCPDFELYNLQHPTEKASIYAPRYYAMSQENASWVIQGLLVTIPPPSQQFCYEVLKHDPELIDLLFKCAVVPREAWYPELEVDAIICQSIIMLFRIPICGVPGIPVSLDVDFPKTTEEEWKAVLDSLNLLTSRPNWVEMILAVWWKMSYQRASKSMPVPIFIFVSVI